MSAATLRHGATIRPIWVQVSGASMGRAIRGGAEVLVTAADAPRRGEVWAFRAREGHLVVHRFLGARGDQLWFKGDANSRTDVPVTADDLVGRVVAWRDGGRIRRLGHAQRMAARCVLDVRAALRRFETIKNRRGR